MILSVISWWAILYYLTFKIKDRRRLKTNECGWDDKWWPYDTRGRIWPKFPGIFLMEKPQPGNWSNRDSNLDPLDERQRRYFRHFAYVRTHSPTIPSLYLRHSSFSNPSVASPTSQFILQPFFRFSYFTSSSLNSPGEPPMPFWPYWSLRKSVLYYTPCILNYFGKVTKFWCQGISLFHI